MRSNQKLHTKADQKPDQQHSGAITIPISLALASSNAFVRFIRRNANNWTFFFYLIRCSPARACVCLCNLIQHQTCSGERNQLNQSMARCIGMHNVSKNSLAMPAELRRIYWFLAAASKRVPLRTLKITVARNLHNRSSPWFIWFDSRGSHFFHRFIDSLFLKTSRCPPAAFLWNFLAEATSWADTFFFRRSRERYLILH